MTNINPISWHACEDCLHNKYGYSFAISDAHRRSIEKQECPDCHEISWLFKHQDFQPHHIRNN